MKIVIVGINGTYNSGDHAQLSALISVLKEAFPTASLSAVHRDPRLESRSFPDIEWLQEIGVSYSNSPMYKRFQNTFGLSVGLANLVLGLRSGLGLCRSQRATFKALSRADVVVACPGGYLIDGCVSILVNLLHLWIASAHERPVFFAPQSFGPFRYNWTKRKVKGLLDKATAVCVREPISQSLLHKIGIPQHKVFLFPDMAFFETAVDQESATRILERIGITPEDPIAGTTLMDWAQVGGTKACYKARYMRDIASVARRLYQTHGIRTLFLRQIADAKGMIGDGGLLEQARELVGDAGVFPMEYLGPEILRGVIGRCLVFWGTRMHSNIFALGQSVPTVAICYNPKTRGIMRMFGLEDFCVEITSFTSDALYQKIENAISSSQKLSASIKNILTSFRLRREELVVLLRKTCN